MRSLVWGLCLALALSAQPNRCDLNGIAMPCPLPEGWDADTWAPKPEPAQTPEPGTWVLCAVGVMGVMYWRARR